ncbi:MAG: hypothetical protein Q9174_003013 [Haloplaca sp. 1 TL-2023]
MEAANDDSEWPKSPTEGFFEYSHDEFTVFMNYPRESHRELERLLFPEFIKCSERRLVAQTDARDILNRDWVEAQLRHYDILFPPDLDSFKMKALLVTSVAHGLCKTVPPQVAGIEQRLKFQSELQEKQCQPRYDRSLQQKLPVRIRAFDACSTPSEEANFDDSLFLRKYFLGKDGLPDKARTPHVMKLPDFRGNLVTLSNKAECIPGLYVAKGVEVMIGWDRSRVSNMARGGDRSDLQAPGEVEAKHERLQSTIHEQLIKDHLQKEYNRTSKHLASARLKYQAKSLTGTYSLVSDAISRQWPDVSEKLQLRAFHSSSGRFAVFDLGVLFGMMIIGKSDEEIGVRLAKDHWRGERNNTGSESESEDFEMYRNEDPGYGGGKSVRDDVTPDKEPGSFDYSQSPARPKKRQRTDGATQIRLSFRWRGYNTITGSIQPENTGYLDFTAGAAAKIRGVMQTDITETDIIFVGHKMDLLAYDMTQDWEALSNLDTDKAKLGKHIREMCPPLLETRDLSMPIADLRGYDATKTGLQRNRTTIY